MLVRGLRNGRNFSMKSKGRSKPSKPCDLIIISQKLRAFSVFFSLSANLAVSPQICTLFWLSVRKAAAAFTPNLPVGLLPFPARISIIPVIRPDWIELEHVSVSPRYASDFNCRPLQRRKIVEFVKRCKRKLSEQSIIKVFTMFLSKAVPVCVKRLY